jgi:antitoxin ParD1/3/4
METGRSTLLVDLGDQMRVVEERVRDGSYASPDEVIRAALRDFDRGGIADDAWLVELAEKSLADPRPSVPAEQVFRELREKYGRPAVESAR